MKFVLALVLISLATATTAYSSGPPSSPAVAEATAADTSIRSNEIAVRFRQLEGALQGVPLAGDPAGQALDVRLRERELEVHDHVVRRLDGRRGLRHQLVGCRCPHEAARGSGRSCLRKREPTPVERAVFPQADQ